MRAHSSRFLHRSTPLLLIASSLTLGFGSHVSASNLGTENPTDPSVTDGNHSRHSHAYDPVVITGSRTEKLLSDSPVKIELVSRREIQLKNARDLKEAIKDVPGLSIKKIHGKAGYGAWMQGVDAKRVLVLIDGDPVSKSTNEVTDLTQIGVMNIEQIEILKGATSALYGSGAIGGVINIITHKPTTPFGYILKADLGSNGSQNTNGNTSAASTRSSAGWIHAQNEVFDAQFNFDLRDTDGFTVDQDTWEREGPEGHKLNLQSEVGFSPNALSRYFASAAYYDENLDRNYTGSGPNFFDMKKTEAMERMTYRTGSDWLLGNDGDLNIRYSYEEMDNATSQYNASNSLTVLKRSATHKTQKLSSQWNFPVADHVTRTLGLEYIVEDLDQSKWDPTNGATPELGADRSEKVFFFQDDMQVGERLSFLPGIRFQNDSDFGNYLAPKLNGRIELDDIGPSQHFIRFGVGRGYKAPSLKERFYTFDHSHLGYQVHGNPSLTPEYSDSFQLGWAIKQSGLFNLDINLFQNNLEDFIETRFNRTEVDPDFGVVQIFEYTNITEAKTRGVELASSLHLSKSLNLNSGYTYLSATNKENGKRLPKRPRHQLKANLSYDTPDNPLALSFSMRWQSEEYFDLENQDQSPGYSVFDLSSEYRISDLVSLYAGIDNIGDKQRDFERIHDLRPDEGRYVYLGLRLNQE